MKNSSDGMEIVLKIIMYSTFTLLALVILSLYLGGPVSTYYTLLSSETLENASASNHDRLDPAIIALIEEHKDDIVFSNVIEFYDKLITFLLGLIAVSAIVGYVYVKGVSFKYARQKAEDAVKIYIDSKVFDDLVASKTEELQELMYESLENTSINLEELSRLKEEINKMIAKSDSNELIDDKKLVSKKK